MNIFSKLWLLLVFMGLPMLIIAQNSTDSKVIKTEEGKFIIHKVEKGQTLYAISKMYSVSVEDIQKANPDIQEFGIRIDQTLRIPVKSVNKKEAKKSTIELSGDTIYHEVIKKETLYALSKKYEISVEDIEKFNPAVKDGLQIGIIIKIPSVPSNKTESAAEEFKKPKEDSLILHEVLPKETLFSLSKMYGVSTDSIQMVNDGLQLGLQIGATVRIPRLNPDFLSDTIFVGVDSLKTVLPNALNISDTIVIGIFLPFCIEKNLAFLELNRNKKIYGLTKISVEFYRGFSMAIDSLKNLGFSIDIRYFDSENDTNSCVNLLSEIDLKNVDLIIGPLFQNNFNCVAQRAKLYGIPIVSPVKVSSSLLLDNRFVVKSYASSPSMVINMAEFVAKDTSLANITIISGSESKDARYADIFQKHLNSFLNDSIPVNKMWQPSTDNYKGYIQKGQQNNVVIISSDEAFVSQSISVLYRMLDDDTQISVYGLDSWKNFRSIGFDYLDSLNVTFPTQKNIDYNSQSVTNFINSYRKSYYSEPSEHVFSAFDVGIYFVKALFNGSGKWEEYIDTHVETGLVTRFDFVKISDISGFENRGGFILEYKDYSLILVD